MRVYNYKLVYRDLVILKIRIFQSFHFLVCQICKKILDKFRTYQLLCICISAEFIERFITFSIFQIYKIILILDNIINKT